MRADTVIAVQHEIDVEGASSEIEGTHRVGAHLWSSVFGRPDGQTVVARHWPFRLGDAFRRYEQHEMWPMGRITPEFGARQGDAPHVRREIDDARDRHLPKVRELRNACSVAGPCKTRSFAFDELDQVTCRHPLHSRERNLIVSLDAHHDAVRASLHENLPEEEGGRGATVNRHDLGVMSCEMIEYPLNNALGIGDRNLGLSLQEAAGL